MAKAILLVRVSTERQSFDEQQQQLFNLAIKDGYTEDNIITIAEKESGRKLKEDERKGLNKMKEYIESDSSINCVYAWECSRIARRKVILFSILEFLQERKIQLIIKEPYLKMLNDDGSINEMSEMGFTLFAQLSESEMRNKDARFKRAKDEMKRNHQYRGGFLPYGYTVNEQGKIIIDEEKAPLVRLLFNLYVDGISQYKLSKEVEKRGYDISYNHIVKILGNINYCTGELYPILISKELWDKKCKQAKLNNTVIDKSNNLYFGAKLIKCDCGSSYIASSSTATYLCKSRYIGKECNNTKNVAINIMDSILWFVAKNEYASFLANKSQETKQRLINEKEVWLQKINALDSLYDKIATKEKRSNTMYKNLRIDDEEYEKDMLQYKNERIELDNNKTSYQEEINRIDDILNSEYSNDASNIIDSYIIPMETKTEELLNELDKLSDERKYQVVHQFINKVTIQYNNPSMKQVTVISTNFIGLEREQTFNVYARRFDKNKSLEYLDGTLVDGFKYFNRFKRKPIKDIDRYREQHKEYARKYRARKKGAN